MATVPATKVSREEVADLLRYNPASGQLHWRQPPKKRSRLGQAGHLDEGYIRVRIAGRSYQATHLIWLLVHGVWPVAMIDHRDGDTINNRLGNLREATNAQNQQNKKPQPSATGLKGVTAITRRGRTRYRAQIFTNGRMTVLGRFDCPSVAHAAYCAEASKRFGDFARFA